MRATSQPTESLLVSQANARRLLDISNTSWFEKVRHEIQDLGGIVEIAGIIRVSRKSIEYYIEKSKRAGKAPKTSESDSVEEIGSPVGLSDGRLFEWASRAERYLCARQGAKLAQGGGDKKTTA